MGYSRPSIIERRLVSSDDLLHSHDALVEIDATIETLAKEITIASWMTETDLRFKCKYKRKVGGTASMGFYRNDVLVAGGSGIWSQSTDLYEEESADLSGWVKGDKFGVKVYCTGALHVTQVKELRVYGLLSYFNNSY
jgi:hypothetical protein